MWKSPGSLRECDIDFAWLPRFSPNYGRELGAGFQFFSARLNCEYMGYINDNNIRKSEPEARLQTKIEIAAFCGVTVRTLEMWMRAGRIPFFKIGRTVRFKLEDVVDHLRKN